MSLWAVLDKRDKVPLGILQCRRPRVLLDKTIRTDCSYHRLNVVHVKTEDHVVCWCFSLVQAEEPGSPNTKGNEVSCIFIIDLKSKLRSVKIPSSIQIVQKQLDSYKPKGKTSLVWSQKEALPLIGLGASVPFRANLQ